MHAGLRQSLIGTERIGHGTFWHLRHYRRIAIRGGLGANSQVVRPDHQGTAQRRDLTALSELTHNVSVANPPLATVQRLSNRGFIGRKAHGRYQVTLKGRVALLLRRLVAASKR